ncbi:M20 family metallopeptidase [Pseudorhodoferax sp.]|uniref:M20 family metallopeptidase n=1 Tax=Pseudorhodoferax sp. TaxID=1993553 RepID=UPI002DD64BBC|nr:M20 family metallopeptidase [Pseudorhodoferax sp.]
MARDQAIRNAEHYFDSGAFLRDLTRRVAFRTECQDPARAPDLRAYLADELLTAIGPLGFDGALHENPVPGAPPFLVAQRIEQPGLPTVLVYGHGDVVRGQDAQWQEGLAPWTVRADGDRLYGRGSADNKGQHTINLGALAAVIDSRTRAGEPLGFNVKLLFEMGEEVGSPGLTAICGALRDTLRADLLVASDGPRINAGRPTVFLGSRGAINFDLAVQPRARAYHSGNWGGLLRNPATRLAHALATLVDAQGRILVDGLRPPAIPTAVRAAIADLQVGTDPGDPAIDLDWGEPGLSPAERVFGWNTLEVLAMTAGNASNPVGAIPASAKACCQLRFVVGTAWQALERTLRAHLDAHGFDDVGIEVGLTAPATRLPPDNPWVGRVTESLARTSGKPVAVLPNLGGTIPNDAFADVLGLPTIWIPHSYPGCAQHAPNEHLLASTAREGLQLMAGLFWDLGDLPAAQWRVGAV